MCGRYYIEIEHAELEEIVEEVNRRLKVKYEGTDLDIEKAAVKGGEIFPFSVAPVEMMEKEKIVPVAMRWGFPISMGKKKDGTPLAPKPVFNARVETAREKPLFKKPLLEKRVVVPTSGFFEWNHPNGKPQDKFLFTEPGKEILYLAGMYNVFDWNGVKFPHYTILTTEPNDSMRPYHNRMPILLEEDEREAWLSGSDLEEVLKRVPFELAVEAA